MYRIKAPKKLFPLTLPCLIWAQAASAELNEFSPDGQDRAPMIGVYPAYTEAGRCPQNKICTGDIVLFNIGSNFVGWQDYTVSMYDISVANDAADPNKGFHRVKSDTTGTEPADFYYRVHPGKTYYFKVMYGYHEKGDEGDTRAQTSTKYFYYKSSSGDNSPGGSSSAEGIITQAEAERLGLPPIPKCYTLRSPAQFSVNQVVHVFWDNNRGEDKAVTDIEFYVNGRLIKRENGPEFRGSNFNDYYYTLPCWQRYIGGPMNFQVKWKTRPYPPPWNHAIENSESLSTSYAPGLIFACQPRDSWEKCQNIWQDYSYRRR